VPAGNAISKQVVTMPIIEPENQTVKALKGVHLYHSAYSNCSQRARLVLEEKGVTWQGHHINLMKFEHLTEEYQTIHPGGVVPALVHDGNVIIESHDIIQYLDDHFPGPLLMPQTEDERTRIMPWMERGAAIQPAVKTLTYEHVFRYKYPPTPERYDHYAAHQRNPELVDFFRRFLEGFDPDELKQHEATIQGYLADLDTALAESDYLAGDTVTLADFSAIVNVHRAKVLAFDFADYPNLDAWYARMAARPSFERAITAYVPG